MSRYAEATSVSSDRSRAEIERILQRYGATGFFYGWNGPKAVVGFVIQNRHIKMVLPLPDRKSREFTHTPGRNLARTPRQVEEAYEQAVRQRWRALALIIKAKLEAVESGISTIEDEFMANIVLPDGQTIGQWIKPQIARAYDSADMPPLLPDFSGG